MKKARINGGVHLLLKESQFYNKKERKKWRKRKMKKR